MAARLYTSEEFEAELSGRRCNKIGTTTNGTAIWQDEKGRPFSVSPPEELENGEPRYPDWMLDDIIRSVGLPIAKRRPH